MGKEERKSDIKEELRRLLTEDREIRDLVCRIVSKSEGAADKQDSIRKKGEWETLIRWLSRVFSKEGKVGTPRELKEEIEAKIQRLCEESRQLSESLRQQEEETKTAQEELLRQREAAETYRAEAERGREETASLREETDSLRKEIDSLRKETESLRAESGQLSARLREKDEEAEKGREEIDSLRAENQRLSDRLRQKEDEAESAQEELLRQREAAETYRAEAEKGRKEIDSLRKETDSLREEIESIRKESDALRKELSKAKALLRKHFEKGDAIFSAYRSLPVERRERLSRVIRGEDDFESFICCLTQEEAMKAFWDMAKETDACGDAALRDCLYEIFVYSLALVNRTRNRPFELLSVKKGAAFARDEMEPAARSKAQGKVQDVRLPGFRNLYTDAVERKSVVVL